MNTESTGTVVVGVDGSPGSRAALEYALDEAARRGARLQVVVAAQLPDYWAMAYGPAAPPPVDDIVDGVRNGVQAMVDEVLAARPAQAGLVSVSVLAQAGSPAGVLLEAAEGADVLVLGHRGRGALRSALLGSVGLQCVLHAPCPVTIVRPQPVREPATDRAEADRALDPPSAATIIA
jgi:nucleotide-binding universal stress UspA family protein